ncbi:MAG: lysophospholipase [Chloroflexota bacterium]|jgi:alpha-beta hydrolase superfamily lysophospholipase
MSVQEFSWVSEEKIHHFGVKWQPVDKPRAAIILMHGLGEHCMRYQHVADYFNRQQFTLYACDHAGHGRSEGGRGHVDSYQWFFNEIDLLCQRARQDYHPSLPLFLYGHSLGGSIVLAYSLSKKPAIAGIVASSPGIKLVKDPGILLLFGKLLNRIAPSTPLNNGLVVEGISRDPAVVDAYRKDPLVHPWISARLALELIEKGEWIRANGAQISVPLLLLHGNKDMLTAVEGSRELASKNNPYIHYIEWEAGYHELHNEPDNQQVLSAIFNWMEHRITQT